LDEYTTQIWIYEEIDDNFGKLTGHDQVSDRSFGSWVDDQPPPEDDPGSRALLTTSGRWH
jgi:hypothetical protein